MAQQNYGPTPPRLLSFPDGSRLPTSPDAGTLKTFDSETLSLALFGDALGHDLALVEVLPDECVQVEVTIEAMDPAGAGRLASGTARLQVARVGAGAPTIVGTPMMLTYTPNAAPWNTITGDLVVPVAPPNSVVVQVFGLANTPIRWRAQIRVVGAQSQQVS